ncbi:PREDICTED: protein mahjong [Nicrophorus vespilloides]|uniref:Protein mahjong n=1 Tax=Nicrophorus vespilloides TaxID=110193 RepID=A0ABM1M0C9_NICVS|nr:PREDICTED: protein mahjong [Nicrophorus vespilloides]XP_017768030.1 PREDICTED: protein mahjong [Nicrophorus vespilloides]
MEPSNVMADVTNLIKEWEEQHELPMYDPVPTLNRLAEIIEIETENYLKMDPDPFDERHPSRADPECKLGQILKALFKKESFMTKLVNDYLRDTYFSRLSVTGRSVDQLNIGACRLMLDILPGLETTVVFQPDHDGLILRLIKWATESIEPLQTYATGLLAAAMEIPEIATRFREQNSKLVPLFLKRLRRLQKNSDFIPIQATQSSRPFAHFAKSPMKDDSAQRQVENGHLTPVKRPQAFLEMQHSGCSVRTDGDNEEDCNARKKLKLDLSPSPPTPIKSPPPRSVLYNKNVVHNESSNSSWAELETFMIGSIQIFPPTHATRQILILRYLTPMGEYQEYLSHVFENNALELILSYVNVRETKKARLAFEALKYLAALLCHKKFSIEFIQFKGLDYLLEVPRPSIAATGVSICLYYLGYCEEAMERVCLLPKYMLSNLVQYALWLLECSHDSGRCHATMFFGLTFQFKVVLDEFDAQDGLRKLHNVISTLSILSNDAVPINEDTECAARQIVRHVCVAYKRYLEAHLSTKSEQMRRSQMRPSERSGLPSIPSQPTYKPCKSSPEEVEQQIETLLQNMPFKMHWLPVEQLLKLGAITLLLKIIAFAYEWNYSGRAETVRCALDVIYIACVMPRVQMLLCERVDLPEESITLGITIVLGAAEGEIVADADVQKSALRIIVNCVCAPVNRIGGNMSRFSSGSTQSPSKKTKVKSSEELIQRVWDCFRTNNGIMVLLQLMNIKIPITDADCMRTLACKALAGLARSDTVKQIVSKLPLFQNGQLQSLMRDPILQEKRQEHVTFQKYALELLERLSGKATQSNSDTDVSLVNIHRASVVAQTKIQFNDKQLMQLIHQHLMSKGLSDTASALQKEANLATVTLLNQNHPSKFRYSSPSTPTRTRLSFSTHTPIHRNQLSITAAQESQSTTSGLNGGGPSNSPAIKIIKKINNSVSTPVVSTPPNSRLQKQISNEPQHMKVLPLTSIEDNNVEPRITLESIITEYLTNQHALCKNPMATCPQFNLFVPHKCPDPKPRITASNNFIVRCARRQMGFQSRNMDRRLTHSRFCPVQTIRLPNDDLFFTCAKFMPGDKNIVVGDFSGEVRLFNMNTGNVESMFQAHDSYIMHMEPNWKGDLLLTSTTWGRPLSALWSMKDYDMKFPLENEDYVEFSKVSQDKILGTEGEAATIFDVATGLRIQNLVPTISNQYTKNMATFSPNDELVLSDGVLFDVASGKPIHKLDKLNQTQSGVFHPNRFEIVSNTEVWDLRTFHLLKTVPALNQCTPLFSPLNNVIYALKMEQETDEDTMFDSSFKTIDAVDYSNIATIDVKRNIHDLVVNKFDTLIAVVENQGMYHSVKESVVRLYDVGRRRDDEDDLEEEDEEDDMGSDDDGSDIPTILDMDADDAEANTNDNDDDESEDLWTDLSGSEIDSSPSDSTSYDSGDEIVF